MPKISLGYNIEWDEKITLPAMTKALQEKGLGRDALIALLQARNDELCDQLCGQKYKPDHSSAFERKGSKKRTLGTRFGKIQLHLSRVRNKITNEWFCPIWSDVIVEPRKIFQLDIIGIMQSGAQRMSYRNTSEEIEAVVLGEVPSPCTVNRRIKEIGPELAREIKDRELVATTHQPDDTKVHAQDGGHHRIMLVLATGPNKRPRLRGLAVGKKWKEHDFSLDKTIFKDGHGRPSHPTVVSDLEPGLGELFTPENGVWQPCVNHVVRDVGHNLWADGLKMSATKRGIMGSISGILEHLKNSVRKHVPLGEVDAVEHRMKQTTKELRRRATILDDQGYHKTAEYLRRVSNTVTVFAALALQGIEIPCDNNVLERIMGEVGKRFKHKWMSWTVEGAEALLVLLIVRTIEPDTYKKFWNRKLYGVEKPIPGFGLSFTSLEATC
jgi:hypothetical protein